MNDRAARQGRPATIGTSPARDDSKAAGLSAASLTTEESAQLRALIFDAPAEAFDREQPESRELAERIVTWHHCRPVARGDLNAAREIARAAVVVELERYRAVRSIDQLVDLLRRTEIP